MSVFCCDIIEDYSTRENNIIKYFPEFRSYNLILHDDPHGTHQKIDFCPWCGASFPEELGEEWDRILRVEYGIEDAAFSWNFNKIPSEFKTDEWWKKRGL